MKKALIVIVLGMILSFVCSAQSPEGKELTLKEAIYHALKNNLDLQVQKTNAEVSRLNWRIDKTIYLPTFQFQSQYDKSRQPSNSTLDGVEVIEGEGFDWSATISQRVPLGGTLSAQFASSRSESNRLDYTLNPQLFSSGRISFSQPLLRNFGTLATNYQIYIDGNNLKINQLLLEENIITLVYNVESAYWELVYAHQNLEAAKTALKRARDLLNQNEIKVKVGTAAPIEILSSKANVARNESAVIQAEQNIQTREEVLKRILNISKEPYAIIPIDSPEIKELSLNFDSMLLEALENRPEIKRAQLDLKNQNITVKYRKNQALPILNLAATLISYGQAGTIYYNTKLDPNDPDFARILVQERKFSDAVKDLIRLENNYYAISLNLEIPIPFTREKAQVAIAKVAQNRSLLQLKNVENTIFSEVKEVIKAMESHRKLVEADRIALELEGENLKAEEKKLSVGLSTNFQVLQYQQQYASAQTQLLRSTINYVLTFARINQIMSRTFNIYDIKIKEFIQK